MKKAIMFLLSVILLTTPVFATENKVDKMINTESTVDNSSYSGVDLAPRTKDEYNVFIGTINIINDVIYLYQDNKEEQKLYIDAFMSVCVEYYYNKLDKAFTVNTVNDVLRHHGLQILSKIEE